MTDEEFVRDAIGLPMIPYTLEEWMKLYYPSIYREYEKRIGLK